MKGTIIWGKTENLNRTHNLNISVQTINGLDILTNLFTLLITIKTKTELEVISKVILKKDSIFGPNSRLFSLIQNIY